MKLAAVIWDMDGTLLDSVRVVTGAFKACVQAAGGIVVTEEDVVAAYPLGPPTVIIGQLLGRQAEQEEVDYFYAMLASGAADDLDPYPAVRDALDLLNGRTRLAVFTGGSRRAAHILLGAANLLEYFEHVVGGDEVSRPKPEPDGLLETCARLAVAPERCAYVGDSPLDLEAAGRAGLQAVAAGWGHLITESSRRVADVILSHPTEVLQLLDDHS